MSNVFGNPVTNDTVREIYIGMNPADITTRLRAEVALQYMNSDNKANRAREHTAWLKNRYGNGTSTRCCIYNATGGNVSFIRSHTWEGSVYFDPYPQLIQNGQWAAFLHVRGRLMGPSKEAIVYRGQNNNGASRDWVLAWNTGRGNNRNKVNTEIRTGGATVNWGVFNSNMSSQGLNHSVTTLGCFSSVSIGSGGSPYFTGIMTLDGLNANAMALASDISTIFPSLDSEHNDEEEGGGEGDEEGEEDDHDHEATPAAAPAPAPAAAAAPPAE